MTENNEKSDGNGKDKDKDKEVTIEVNSKPVVLTEKFMTGEQIKAAGIAQGVQIQADFVLQLEKDDGEFDTIGDQEEIRIRKDMSFTAISPDDNS